MSDKEYPCKHGCGKVLKSRAGIYKHELKCDYSMGVSHETLEDLPSSPFSHEPEVVADEATAPSDSNQPTYTQYTYTSDEVEDNMVIPSPLKFITGGNKTKSGKKKNKAELATMAKTNEAMLSMGYKTIDTVASKYRVAITGDESMVIQHSESDYKWISGMSNAYLVEKGIDINAYFGTGKAALICNSYWFGSIAHTLHKDAKKLDKSLGLLRKPMSGIRKLLSFIPIIGKRFRTKPQIDIVGQTVEDELE
jgi:hypothetical protein